MRTKTVLLIFSVLAALAPAATKADPRLETLAQAVLQGGSPGAIENLRQEGPAGMEALLALAGSGGGDAVDRACGVRDCADIRLFWYTDLEAAKAAARATDKPILSLRLMGRLDEEFSCANSRFFRTVYYKNRELNDLLRERFVLHWRSVRPVPRVTIDFGDGTRLERTLTGNSIHYVLDSRGRMIEALPGLSGPEAFRSALEGAEAAARNAGLRSDADLALWLAVRHQTTLETRAQSLRRDLAEDPETRLEKTPNARDPWAILQSMPGVRTERLNVGGLETGSKRISEIPILSALAERVSDDQLRNLARLRRPRIHLDAASRAFLLAKHGVTDPAEAERLIDSFETTVALDEVINEYRTGPAILQKLSDPEDTSSLDLDAFNQWVYEDVFRTPLSDPWLGLAPDDIYVALPAWARTAPSPTER